jgi:hypothetical protein
MIDKEKLVEKLKSATPEERTLFREALQEAEPGTQLSMDEVLSIRKMLEGTKKGKEKKGLLETLLGS